MVGLCVCLLFFSLCQIGISPPEDGAHDEVNRCRDEWCDERPDDDPADCNHSEVREELPHIGAEAFEQIRDGKRDVGDAE